MKSLICFSLMSVFVLSSFASAATPEVQARESLTRLTERYRTVKYGARDEISMACLGEVYSQWFVAYDRASHQALVEMASRVMAYQEAKTLNLAHEEDATKLYPELRPQLMKATRDVLTEMRSNNTIPTIPGPMSLTETYTAQYDANLQKCMQADYIRAVETKAPPATGFNMAAIVSASMYWVISDEGGSSNPGIVPGSGVGKTSIVRSEAKMSLADWLDQIRAR